ncbi:MAG TPA: hypothetical protein VD861_07400 [Pyrinomonadaceae bacterium]|nr:hypothetical protein [Pyrinomonadaceae bacterium]
MLASPHILAQDVFTVHQPSYFIWVFGLLLIAGVVAWLVATVIGFARARASGLSTRWFAAASACMILYHLHWLALAFGIISGSQPAMFLILALLNIFVVLGAICTIIGFARLKPGTDSSPSSS